MDFGGLALATLLCRWYIYMLPLARAEADEADLVFVKAAETCRTLQEYANCCDKSSSHHWHKVLV